MTRAEAARRMVRLGLRGRVGRCVTSPGRRAAAKAALERVQAEERALQQRIYAVFGVESERLGRERNRLREEEGEYKFRLFRRDIGFDILVAKGETWEEVFAMVEQKTVRRLA